MAWLSKLFSAEGVNLTATVGKVIDDLVTNDEELSLTEVQKLKIKTAYELEVKSLFIRLDQQQAKHEENLGAEISTRLSMDMKSDSWLSKNIRPLVLIFFTLVTSVMAFLTILDSNLSEQQLRVLKEWIPFFSTIMLTIYAFYFGSRGFEKIQKIRSAGSGYPGYVASQQTSKEREPRG